MHRELAEAIASLLAAVVLLGVTHWLLGQLTAKRFMGFVARRMGDAVNRSAAFGILGLSFIAAYREAFEIVLFFKALLLDAGEHAKPRLARRRARPAAAGRDRARAQAHRPALAAAAVHVGVERAARAACRSRSPARASARCKKRRVLGMTEVRAPELPVARHLSDAARRARARPRAAVAAGERAVAVVVSAPRCRRRRCRQDARADAVGRIPSTSLGV